MRLRPLYSCAELCARTRDQPDGDERARAAARCCLPGFDVERWDPRADREVAREAEALAVEIAAAVDAMGVGYSFVLDRDGCPWAWAQSRWCTSVAGYMGQRTLEHAVRSPSLRLSRRMQRDTDEPEQLLDAVSLAEAFEDAALARYWEIVSRP